MAICLMVEQSDKVGISFKRSYELIAGKKYCIL